MLKSKPITDKRNVYGLVEVGFTIFLNGNYMGVLLTGKKGEMDVGWATNNVSVM